MPGAGPGGHRAHRDIPFNCRVYKYETALAYKGYHSGAHSVVDPDWPCLFTFLIALFCVLELPASIRASAARVQHKASLRETQRDPITAQQPVLSYHHRYIMSDYPESSSPVSTILLYGGMLALAAGTVYSMTQPRESRCSNTWWSADPSTDNLATPHLPFYPSERGISWQIDVDHPRHRRYRGSSQSSADDSSRCAKKGGFRHRLAGKCDKTARKLENWDDGVSLVFWPAAIACSVASVVSG